MQRVTKAKGPEAATAAGIWSQESENQGGESKNSMSGVNRIGLEQVLLWLTLVGQWAWWDAGLLNLKGQNGHQCLGDLESVTA